MSDDIDERIRRALAADPDGPGADVRENILAHARRLADERRAAPANRNRWRAPALGSAAAAALAGLMLATHFHEARVPATPLTASPAPPRASPAPPPAAAPAAQRNRSMLRDLQAQSATQAQMLRPRDASADALRRAAGDGDMDRLSALLASADVDARDPQGRTALMLAAAQGHTAAVEALLAHGADPNAVGADGASALELARAAGRDGIAEILRRSGAR